MSVGAVPAPAQPAPAAVPMTPPATPVGPKGPNFDPTGTVPVAGSPADPLHPANQPQAAPAAPVVEGPTPPPGYTVETDGSTTSPGPPTTAEEAARRSYLASQAAAKVDQDIAKNSQEQADLATTGAQRRSDLEKKQLAETEAEDARQRAGLQHAQAEREMLQANVKDFRFHNYYDSRTTVQKLLGGIGIILGSASYSKEHVNEASRTIDNAIAQEWKQQESELQQRQDAAKEAGASERELRLQYDYESGKLKLRQEQQLKALASEMDALSARSKNQAGVLQAQKMAAEARMLAEAHGQQGVKDIAAAHSEKLKDAETRAQTANIYSEIAERAAKAQRERTGTLTKKEQLAEANAALHDYRDATKDIRDPKNGILHRQQEIGAAIDKAERDGKNSLNWVGLFDSMIRTNTGKAAIMSQYQLYTGHAAGSVDLAAQGLAKIMSGAPSAKQRASVLGAAKDSQAELDREGAEAERNFRESAFSDPRYASNPSLQKAVNLIHKATFGRLRGYGQEAPAAPAAKIPFDIPKGSTPTGQTAGGKPVYKTPTGQLVTSDVE